ncbi:Peptidase M24A methionine aminopeptidase subfamily 1 [Arabidopsis thaliana x Arabidopsis arenosa]|uniref:Peptidase M24A methionine aminopeptidase subfamily 1 n=1 Tax=Arabidopsis thaliana x Arabidopsis arenosa TaxID=1240361 RepID=A0A8T1ZHH2_9BRAS|nr:Peptidase M24A methionine aminopeptidase subfamily 1 [Arabidopsis thaliana x Arabidopsis arenosa]
MLQKISQSRSLFNGDKLTPLRYFAGAPTNFFSFPLSVNKKSSSLRSKRIQQLQSTLEDRINPTLVCGKVSPRLLVPDHILKPSYLESSKAPMISSELQIPDSNGIVQMKKACKLAARVLDYAGTLVRPFVTTDEIDKAVHQMVIESGAYPSPLGYGGFPKSVCTSVNECMFHGIPDSRPLQNGDIINIDVAVYLDGYHGDTSKTFLCGDVNESLKQLVKVTEECLEKGISVCKDGASFKQIGKIISEHAAKYGYNMERFIGHGVGTVLHSEPLIYLHSNYDYELEYMIEGQTFTLEPILTIGTTEFVTWPDKWTIVTADGGPAAQFEHTILITTTGAEILTIS